MLKTLFPALVKYVETSPATEDYNCIAWACGDNTKWWWPNEAVYWPQGIRCEETVDSFDELFLSGGAFHINSENVEAGIVKIALFALNGVPKHAARQLPNGMWTSKLGKAIDVAHSLRELEGDQYGIVTRLYGVKITL